ncbi:MAG: carboxylesterase/lipase family protein [Ruminococcaceae bacterium]|nr:carboxylesterase/lipase family protein [Oscillospiraceae bacterium]
MNNVKLTTKLGKICGLDFDTYHEFRGIKYATAARWEYPSVCSEWDGEYDATEYGACCFQRRAFENDEECNPFYHREFRQGQTFTYSEDCLFLNIQKPKDAENCPVLIYIHGGSFTGGSNDEGHINGKVYAERGIVYVAINYRLGPYGFCSHPDLTDSKGRCGNFGLYDQVAAVKWVKENIDAFGGDPDNITIMGESAGAMSVDLLISSPAMKGLYKQAMMLSGAAIQRSLSKPMLPEKTRPFWEAVMDKMGAETLDELRASDEKTLYYAWLVAQKDFKMSIRYTLPVYDGELITPENFNMKTIPDVPMLLGITQTDMVPIALEIFTKQYAKRAELNKNDCYVYSFNRNLPGDTKGAWHAADLLYAFGTLERNWRPFGRVDYVISKQMIESLTAFVKTGNPNCDEIPHWDPGIKMPMHFCEHTAPAPLKTKEFIRNTFADNGAF